MRTFLSHCQPVSIGTHFASSMRFVKALRTAARHSETLRRNRCRYLGVDFGLLGADDALIENPPALQGYEDSRASRETVRRSTREEVFRQTGIQVMELNSLYQLYAIHLQAPWLLEQATKLLLSCRIFLATF